MTGIDVPVVVDWPTDGVCRLRLNNPERLNALSGAMIAALRAGIESAERKAAGILVLAGAGRAFCAGADLTERRALDDAGKVAHHRSDKRSVGKECGRTGCTRWCPSPQKKKN